MLAGGWVAETLLVVLRWLHDLAAASFLGMLLVRLLGAWEGAPEEWWNRRLREVIDVTLITFLATGAILGFDRLAHGAGSTYAVILGAKIVASAATYQFAFRWRRSGFSRASWDGRLATMLVAGVMLLGALLLGVFESGIRVNN